MHSSITLTEGDERRTNRPRTIRSDAKTYSLTGLTRCTECGSTLRNFGGNNRPRLVCNGRLKGWGCNQSSAFLDIYEKQLEVYLETFHIPSNYQEKILEMHKKLSSSINIDEEKRGLEGRLTRVTDLFRWGHISREGYLAESTEIRKSIGQLNAFDPIGNGIDALASFLRDISEAWKISTLPTPS